MIKKIILFTGLVLLSLKAIACQCIPQKLLNEITDSKNIFIGKIIRAKQNTYEIEISVIYKGNLNIEKTYKVIQPNDSCHKNRFDINVNYLFFELINDDGFHQCSRTARLEESKDLKILESIYPNRKLNLTNATEIEKLIYDNINLIRLSDGETIDTKSKNILYFNGKSIIKEPKNNFNSHWLDIHYFKLFEDLDIHNEKYDYVIYYHVSHQGLILNEKGKEKLRKRFLKKKSR